MVLFRPPEEGGGPTAASHLPQLATPDVQKDVPPSYTQVLGWSVLDALGRLLYLQVLGSSSPTTSTDESDPRTGSTAEMCEQGQPPATTAARIMWS